MRASKFFFMLFILLLIIIVAAVAALLFVDPSVFRGQLQARATTALGRQVQFIGPISLERSLRPRIIVEDITIGNPQWASSAHFAQVQKAEVQVALIPLLQGDLKVLDVVFNGVNLFIEERPDGINNYTFGDPDAGEKAGLLPDVEQLLIRDATIKHRSAHDKLTYYKIVEARLWNLPEEPERIEGNGIAKGMPFTILLAADSPAELSGPDNPWSIKLDLEGPDMSLTLTGQMNRAFKPGQGNYRINISGKQADSLESLFDVVFPTTGPFDLSWALQVNQGLFHLSELAAHVHGPEGTPDLRISNGEATGGPDTPIRLDLQGQLGDTPIALDFESEKPLKDASRSQPMPVKARIEISDIELNVQGTVIPETVLERFEFDTQLQGKTLQTLARLTDSDLPQSGPYQFSFHTQYAEGDITITNLKGNLKDFERWKNIQIASGEVSLLESGPMLVSMDARLDNIPLSMSLKADPAESGQTGAETWPIKLEASSAGTRVRGEGAVVITEKRKMLQMAARISGNRLESLNPLLGTSLPAVGKFNISANLNSDGDIHEARNLKAQIRGHRVTGRVRWEDKSARPLLTGKLVLDRLALDELSEITSKSSSTDKQIPLLDRPIALDWLKEVDARLDLQVNSITGAPLAIADLRADVTLANGRLSAANQSQIAGVQVDSQIQLTRRKNMPAVSLKATTGSIDTGQLLEQLKLPAWITGTANAVEFDGNSQGKTLKDWLNQAAFTALIYPANLRYADQIVDQAIDITVERAELAAEKERPLTGTFTGIFNNVAFNASASVGSLPEMLGSIGVLPLRVAVQTADVQFKTEGTITLPFESKQFDFNYELSGKEIQGLEPVAEFVLPLKGAFRSEGRITRHGNRFTYEEDVRVGKSDLRADVTILLRPTRPSISASIFSNELHLEDVRLFEVDEDSQPAAGRTRVIPDYTVPVDALLVMDLELDLRAEKIRTQPGDL
ncbi:MAG: AsmA family protein, partial [Deltaproteobacteria bacterium]|nr:AsmA family protein [Deltaproteobacteria bacterium]